MGDDKTSGIERVTGPDGQEMLHLEYDIVDGPIEETSIGLTPEVEEQYDELFYLTMDQPAQAIPRLEALAGKYPTIPVLKNWLMVAYAKTGRDAESDEMGERLWRQHPDYLFARISRAQHHLARGELDRVPEVLGALDLKLMYPHRSVFHISEAVALWSLLAQWSFQRGDDDGASMYLGQMLDIAPDHPMTARTQLLLMPILLKTMTEKMFREPRSKSRRQAKKKPGPKRGRRPPPPGGPRTAR